MKNKEIVIYQGKSGAIEFKGDVERDTIWATQLQIAEIFEVNVRTINEHITNIYQTGELYKNSTIRNFRIVQKEGKREVTRDIQHYNLDMIISVGYRVNSQKATKFRQWATEILKKHLLDGYTINRERISHNYNQFLKSVEDVRKLVPQNTTFSSEDTLELISLFANTWFSLDAYDRGSFPEENLTERDVKITADELFVEILKLKAALISKREATEIFAQERNQGSISGIVGNVFQQFDGKDVYPSLEEKAAHLLYFVVKNHPFVDGNKRSGAFAFIWFLNKTGLLNKNGFTPEVLTSLTLLVAESRADNKDRMISLIINLLK